VNNEAIKALSDHAAAPEIFQRGSMLVRVLQTPKTPKKSKVNRPEGTPVIGAIEPPTLSETLSRVALFVSIHGLRVTSVQQGEEVRAEAGGRASLEKKPKTRPSK